MHSLARIVAGALAVSHATAVYTGFNYGDKHSDGSVKQQSDYESEFSTAKNLVGAPGFTSARLYTSIQDGTTNNPIAAIPAAIAKDTSLLLGVWASAGQQTIDNEIAAIKSAVDQFGDSFASRVAGISVGSEDLYRDSVIGMQNNAGIGEGPDTVASYIDQVRSAIANTALSSVPIGHVDTWTAWVNGSNEAVIKACDFIGFDAYPYFQGTMPNSIEDGKALFKEAMGKTQAAVGGKPIWVTETGWPVSGPTVNEAVPSLQNAQTYWEEVGCNLLFDNVNTWWYTLRDAEPVTPSPSFGVVGSDLSTTPLYNLSCSAAPSSSSAAGGTTKSTSGSATAATSGSSPNTASGWNTPISIPTSMPQRPSSPSAPGASGSNAPGASMTPSASASASVSGGAGGGIGGNAPSATRSPSVSGGVGGGNGPSASGPTGAGSGNGGGGGSNQAATGSPSSMSPGSSSAPSSPQFTGAASVAAVPAVRLAGAVVAMIAFV